MILDFLQQPVKAGNARRNRIKEEESVSHFPDDLAGNVCLVFKEEVDELERGREQRIDGPADEESPWVFLQNVIGGSERREEHVFSAKGLRNVVFEDFTSVVGEDDVAEA